MREIRFRAWDKHNKRMIPWSPQMFSDSSPLTMYGDDFPENDDDFILMQFTGLLDRHGKEIWEGDIVNVPYNHIGKREVKYTNGGFDIAAYKISECEVVGNIWEHPKLLKET